MKRFMCIVAMTAIALMLFTACGGGGGSVGDISLEMQIRLDDLLDEMRDLRNENEQQRRDIERLEREKEQQREQGEGGQNPPQPTPAPTPTPPSDHTTRLMDMNYFNRDGTHAGRWGTSWWSNLTATTWQDNDETIHRSGGLLSTGSSGINSNNVSVTYRLRGNYARFTGTVALYFGHRATSAQSRIRVYGDDVLLYTSPVITGGTLPVSFDINVSGVDELRILRVGNDATIAILAAAVHSS